MLNTKTSHKAAWPIGWLLGFLLLWPALALAQAPPELGSFNPDVGGSAGSNYVSAVEEVDGKFWIGGGFSTVGGQLRRRLVRLNADGSLDTSLAYLFVNLAVNVIKYDKVRGHIYVGGLFYIIGGEVRPKIMRLNRDGTLDTCFQPLTGVKLTGAVFDMLIQPDGKVVIVGEFEADDDPNTPSPPSYIARLNSDGTIDSSFNPPNLGERVRAVLRQSDGKLVVGGFFGTSTGAPRNYLLRLHANGQHDPSFHDPSLANPVYRLKPDTDGHMFVTGVFGESIMRLRPGGQRDPGFQAPDIDGGPVWSIAGHPDGGWLIAGRFTSVAGQPYQGLAWLKADGSLDPRMGNAAFNGMVEQILVQGHRVLAVGRFTEVLGQTRNRAAMLYLPLPELEAFNPSVTALFINGINVVERANDRLWIGGHFDKVNGVTRKNLARLRLDGALDTSVGNLELDRDPVVIKHDAQHGYTYVGGYFTEVAGQPWRGLLRIRSDGTLDPGFKPLVPMDSGFVADLWIQPDGKVVVVGSFMSNNLAMPRYIARLNLDGTFDDSFAPPFMYDVYVMSVMRQGDGKFLVGGDFNTSQRAPRDYLMRLHANGQHDSSFVDPQLDGTVRRLRLDNAGRIIVVGEFNQVHGVNQAKLARLLPNGQHDTSLRSPDINDDVVGWIGGIAPRPGGGWFIGGGFNSVDGQARQNFAELKADGRLDHTRNRIHSDYHIRQLLPLSPYRLVAVGLFTEISGIPRSGIAILDFGNGKFFEDGFED